MNKLFTLTGLLLISGSAAMAQNIQNNPGSNHGNKFEQLGTILPTPNEQRTASGAPGVKYWQQRADYNIKCELDEKNLMLTGSETITYTNNSPDPLTYIWLQLDENEHSTSKSANYQDATKMPAGGTTQTLDQLSAKGDNGNGINITKLTDATGKTLKYTVNKTMMRVDLPVALKTGQKYIFNINWNYKITDRMSVGGRGGYEFFPADGNYLFTMTQWYPRLCVYSDFQGWQNHQFTGRGEFALTFGDFKVQMTVPADHLVGSTGECINYSAVLTPTQLSRYNTAKTATAPVEIQTLAEAKAAEAKKSTAKKTWVFNANNVRDFAWTSSRKFVWDAMPQKIEANNNTVMCMSFYGKEAYNLYSKFSTRAVAHTIKTYSDFTIPYPYPVAQSIEAANGMEYPMICFNYGRTDADGTYSESTKNGMLGVIIHEVGHNFFPMIVNSDERQWTWMDEGLNSFVEYLTEELWDNKFPSKKGPAYTIVDYMKLPKDELEPIMTNSENIVRFGPNAYSKPATGLNILRETIMGRELFDYAFKEYSRRWAFKHPEPADLFRTMEDASGEDLDWFWRGWFYGTDPCDISLDSVKFAKADFPKEVPAARSRMVKVDKPALNAFEDISKIRNREDKKINFYVDKNTGAQDFYYKYDRGMVTVDTTATTKQEMAMPYEVVPEADQAKYANKFLYELSFSNKGGLVMPIIVEFTYKDGTKEIDRIPAQIWRHNELKTSKFYVKDKEVASILVDPLRETADIDTSNNAWGGKAKESKFRAFKMKAATAVRGQSVGSNPMKVAGSK
ncbi:M1 family metallopeptidase [Pedobacter sp. MC2016-05]|uniref:M1 family metallopeptidase n=1 Tax=Pedobacter sp. MC2016-05 TaxID=2994474 RepID=UPI00224866F5|nr:M1 family metallopeptidase [Pedobacter sp. MC2016-05]MCX2473154.1 M1 family metallopeptidase [Pedobacter sp. MC2016-05]